MAKKDYINAKLEFYKLEISGFMAGLFLMAIGVFTIENRVIARIAALCGLACFVGIWHYTNKYFSIADELNEL